MNIDLVSLSRVISTLIVGNSKYQMRTQEWEDIHFHPEAGSNTRRFEAAVLARPNSPYSLRTRRSDQSRQVSLVTTESVAGEILWTLQAKAGAPPHGLLDYFIVNVF